MSSFSHGRSGSLDWLMSAWALLLGEMLVRCICLMWRLGLPSGGSGSWGCQELAQP